MNIMLICAGGMSTGILMKKMTKWGDEKGRPINVKAYGILGFESEVDQYDVLLIGPQISYKLNDIKNSVDKPVAQIASFDYAIGNVDNIMKSVDELLKK